MSNYLRARALLLPWSSRTIGQEMLAARGRRVPSVLRWLPPVLLAPLSLHQAGATLISQVGLTMASTCRYVAYCWSRGCGVGSVQAQLGAGPGSAAACRWRRPGFLYRPVPCPGGPRL